MRNLKPLIVSLFLLAAPGAAEAGPDRVSLLLGSGHIGAKMEFQETNPGLFLTWEGEWADFSVGAYRNSYGRGSFAAMLGVPVMSGNLGEVSLMAGVAYYPKDGRTFRIHAGDFVPLVGLQVVSGNFFLQALPGDGVVIDGLVAAGLTFSLD